MITNNKSYATQNFVPIKEINNGVVVLKDGSLRSIIMVSSVNFGLKSQDEKNAILLEYQNFLNSLDFPIQIFIQSRRLDIKPYINLMEDKLAEQTNDLLKIQMREYIEYIKHFTDTHNVMAKNFFIVIPYTPSMINTNNKFIEKILPFAKKGVGDNTNFDENTAQLNQRVNVVKNGIGRFGLRSENLETEELIELYFKIFNPGERDTPQAEKLSQL